MRMILKPNTVHIHKAFFVLLHDFDYKTTWEAKKVMVHSMIDDYHMYLDIKHLSQEPTFNLLVDIIQQNQCS